MISFRYGLSGGSDFLDLRAQAFLLLAAGLLFQHGQTGFLGLALHGALAVGFAERGQLGVLDLALEQDVRWAARCAAAACSSAMRPDTWLPTVTVGIALSVPVAEIATRMSPRCTVSVR